VVSFLLALVPSAGVLLLFVLAVRGMIHADRRERLAQARIEAEADRRGRLAPTRPEGDERLP
jgi:hypothetical protein